MVIVRRTFPVLLLAFAAFLAQAQERFITVASTTSTEQSGLFGHSLPIFENSAFRCRSCTPARTRRSISRAIGDADVVFVHAKQRRGKFWLRARRQAAPVV
jgi:tungstate transport system substrate-binding protein